MNIYREDGIGPPESASPPLVRLNRSGPEVLALVHRWTTPSGSLVVQVPTTMTRSESRQFGDFLRMIIHQIDDLASCPAEPRERDMVSPDSTLVRP
jgi:hypothetical protein